jgi:hypothetical protein
LRLVETSRPNVEFAFEAEGKSTFDKLYCFLEGDLWRRRKNGMQVVGHDDEGVELIAAFGPVGEKDVEEEEVGVLLDLEKTTAVRCGGDDEVSAELLRRRERHLGRLKERPGAKAPFYFGP